MKNYREKVKRRRPTHPDFVWMMSASHPSRSMASNPKTQRRFRNYLSNLKTFEPDFGVLRWGDIGRIESVQEDTNGHIFWIKDTSEHGKVESIIRDIDFDNDVLQYWMGAPSVLIEDLVEVYERKRKEWQSQKKL